MEVIRFKVWSNGGMGMKKRVNNGKTLPTLQYSNAPVIYPRGTGV
jgi:hypothetical protein